MNDPLAHLDAADAPLTEKEWLEITNGMEREIDRLRAERPGPGIIFVYLAFVLWGALLGFTVGWLIWH